MNTFTILSISIGVIIVVVVSMFLFGAFESTKPTPPNVESMLVEYTPTSAWFGVKLDEFGNPLIESGKVVLNKKSASTVNPNINNGICGIYTFPAAAKYTPGFPSINSVGTGVLVPYDAGCVDDDQINAVSNYHGCAGDLGLLIRTQDKCLGVDGTFYQEGDFETYFGNCNVSGKAGSADVNKGLCKGSIGIVALGIDLGVVGNGVLDNALCLTSPNYALDATGNLIEGNPVLSTVLISHVLKYKLF